MCAKKHQFLPPPAVITGGYYIGHLQREHVFQSWAREILRWRYRGPLDGAHNSRDDNGSKNTCQDRRPTCFHITYNYSRGYDYKATCNMPQHNAAFFYIEDAVDAEAATTNDPHELFISGVRRPSRNARDRTPMLEGFLFGGGHRDIR